MHQAATTVQATFRAYRACKRYLAMKCAAIVIQQRYRATNVAKQQRNHFLEMCQSALVVQACYRGLKVRRKLLQQRQAAVLIQSCFRRHKEMVKYQTMRLSAIIIQNHYRSYTQARGRELARRTKAARTIQSYLRMAVQRQAARLIEMESQLRFDRSCDCQAYLSVKHGSVIS
uniref:Abnormal spindle-like microcephaly-associated protein n=1 Tax=Cyprinus carpio TaxID=7962 RepID=A0A8C2HML8_CYPCA